MEAVVKGTNGASVTFHDSAMVQYYLMNDMQALPTQEEKCALLTVCAHTQLLPNLYISGIPPPPVCIRFCPNFKHAILRSASFVVAPS